LYSMVIDSSGSETAWGISASDAVYICGEVTYNATLQGETARARAAKMLLRKISLEGKMLWSRESSIGLDNVANSVDSEQEIIVVGYTGFANGTAKSVLLRFSNEGKLKSTLIIGESFIEDMAWGVTRAGRYLYVVGHARSSLNDLGDVSVHKLGPDFEILWENYFNNYIIDRARAATVDGDDIYVVGETYWKLLDRQVLVRKYVSPNFALTSEESRIIKLSPLVMGIILFIISIYEMTRHTAVK
jgi:hypothetical protein